MFTIENFIKSTIMLFVTLDAIGNVPLFYSLTSNYSKLKRRNIITRSVILATFILLFFTLLGDLIFDYFEISLEDFKIAGGIVLFLVAIENILGFGELKLKEQKDIALVPLATPLLAGPAAISTAMYSFKVYGILSTLVSILVNSIVAWFILLKSDYVVEVLGENCANMLSKITAFILAGIAVSMIRSGVMKILKSSLAP